MSQPSFIDNFSQQFSLEPSRTALLVIDMQNATGNRNMGLGKLLAEQGQSESAQYRFDRIDNLLIPNIQRLITGFREAGAHVIWITYGANAADASDAPHHIAPIIKATNNIAGQPEHEVVDTTVSTPSARKELSSAVERNAPCVVLFSTRSPGPGFSASTTSCSGWPAMLLVALMIGAMWWGASLASAALAP